MRTARYVCTHCGRKFEAEEKEVLECPGCFWSTSVKREEDVHESVPTASGEKDVKPSFQFKLPDLSAFPLKPAAAGLGVILIIIFIIKVGVPAVWKMGQRVKEISVKKESPAATSPKPGAAMPALSPEQQAVLTRRLQISADRNPSEEEQKILNEQASFKTGFSEKLPSQSWTLQNFKDMVAQQEKFYKVPLPHSYKNKMYDHFEKKYLPGAEAFKNGDLVQARNAWVESLAVPIYAGNVQKHRGVVLTMIRPFITDTLSKIGFINSALVEKRIREQEQDVAVVYQKLVSHIEQKSWKEASGVIEELSGKLNALSNPQNLAGSPADYPASLREVDQDIQATLMELMTVPPPAVTDFEPMRQVIAAKRRVIEGFIPEKLSDRQAKYDEALEMIGHQDWAEAEKKLREIDLPPALVQDAAEKIKILKELQSAGLNPIPKQDNLNPGGGHEAN